VGNILFLNSKKTKKNKEQRTNLPIGRSQS